MTNDPTLEREQIGGNEPMGDPAESDPLAREGGDRDMEREDVETMPDEDLSEGAGRDQTLE